MKNTKTRAMALAGVALVSIGNVRAGELTGSLSFDFNSHFISYGADIWSDGDSPEGTFNPSINFDYQINDSWTLNMGAWLDVNDNDGGSFETKETDVWIGIAYTTGCVTASATYQSWQYASDVEDILDIGLSFDTFLSPSLTLHHRLSSGAAAGFDAMGNQTNGFSGTFLTGSLEHSWELSESFSLTVPFSIGFALDEFHTTESGYGFASIGLQGSYAFNDMASFNFGLTYYDTDEDVVANVDDSFFTYNAGVSFSF